MLSLDGAYAVVGIAGTIVGILFGGFGAWRGWWESPRRREERELAATTATRSAAMADAILGEPEVRDLAGSLITAKRPGLVARTATLELAVATLVNQQDQLNALAGRVDEHDGAIELLRLAAEERIGIRREQEGLLRAVIDRDVIDGEATET